jgi:hypothetical protein
MYLFEVVGSSGLMISTRTASFIKREILPEDDCGTKIAVVEDERIVLRYLHGLAVS